MVVVLAIPDAELSCTDGTGNCGDFLGVELAYRADVDSFFVVRFAKVEYGTKVIACGGIAGLFEGDVVGLVGFVGHPFAEGVVHPFDDGAR